MAEQEPELLGELGSIERSQLDALDGLLPLELGEERQDRMASMELVAPRGQDEEDRCGAEVSDQEAQQVTGRLVGKMEILDDEDDGADPAEALDDAEDELEETGLGVPVELRGAARIGSPRVELRKKAGELVTSRPEEGGQPSRLDLADESSERLDEGGIGQTGLADREACPFEHERTHGVRVVAESADQPGLADARLAPEDDCGGLAGGGAVQCGVELRQLGRPTNESGTLGDLDHGAAMIRGAVIRVSPGSPRESPRSGCDTSRKEVVAKAHPRPAQQRPGRRLAASEAFRDLRTTVSVRGEEDDLAVQVTEASKGLGEPLALLPVGHDVLGRSLERSVVLVGGQSGSLALGDLVSPSPTGREIGTHPEEPASGVVGRPPAGDLARIAQERLLGEVFCGRLVAGDREEMAEQGALVRRPGLFDRLPDRPGRHCCHRLVPPSRRQASAGPGGDGPAKPGERASGARDSEAESAAYFEPLQQGSAWVAAACPRGPNRKVLCRQEAWQVVHD